MPDRRLHLLRHAKSSRDDVSVADHDRPLAPRGRAATAALADHFARVGFRPELVLCSTARRALETLDGVRAALPADLVVSVEERLYGVTAEALLRRVRQLPDAVASVVLVGHNPGFEDLARGLAGHGASDLLARLRAKYPTGGFATLALPESWSTLDWGEATLEEFVVPRDLRAG